MGIQKEQQLGQAFLLFPRKVKTFFENSSLRREKKEAALPASLLPCRGWLYTMLCKCTRSSCAPGLTPTQAHNKPGDLQRAPPWLCAHTQTLPASPSLCHAPATGNVSCRLLQGASLKLCLGPYVLAEHRAMVPGKMTTHTFPNSSNTDGTLLNSFSCTQDSCLPNPTPHTEQLRHIQQTSSSSYFALKSQRVRHNKKGQNIKNLAWHQLS